MKKNVFLILITIACLPATVLGHDPGFSSIILTVGPQQVDASISLDHSDIEGLIANKTDEAVVEISNETFKDLRPEIEAIALEALLLRPGQGEPIQPELVEVKLNADDKVELQLRYPVPSGQTSLSVHSQFLASLPFGHRQLMQVQQEKGEVLIKRILSARDEPLEISIPVKSR